MTLTGFMGTGKTSVGQALAQRLGWKLVDTDVLVERQAGCSIPEIFAREGEARFRERERQAVREAVAAEHRVIATGGGTITDPENLDRLREVGPVVCLTATPEVIRERVSQQPGARPLLAGDDPDGRIRALLRERAAAYGRADVSLDTTGRTIDSVVREIERLVVAREGREERSAG